MEKLTKGPLESDSTSSMDSDSQIVITNEKTSPYPYQLSHKSLKDLTACKPLSDELLNAYVRLLTTSRLYSGQFPTYRFHLFDTMFFHQLSSQFANSQYTFFNFTSFFDKQFTSEKTLMPNSIVLFTVPTTPTDYILVVAYLQTRQLIVLDPLSNTTCLDYDRHLAMLKRFLDDYA